MIKNIILDFDGVCLDIKDIHYQSLNMALEIVDSEFKISLEDHLTIFDGLSTSKKLDILTKDRNFPVEKKSQVNSLKQQYTQELLKTFTNFNYTIPTTLHKLKEEGYKLYVASNAIRATIETGLEKFGILYLFDGIYANEDVKNQKPNPEIYLKCMIDAGVEPKECLIVEDSKHGRHCALASGGYLCEVDNSFDLTYERIKAAIKNAEINEKPVPWYAKNSLNVLILCAGMGSRLRSHYNVPKPLINMAGKTMIQRVVENLNIDANYIFVVQKEHYENYHLETYLNLLSPGCQIVITNGLTAGATNSALMAEKLIDNDKHLLIVNSDQILEWDSSDFLYKMISKEVDGGIITFNKENDPKWSYAELDSKGYVVKVAEKQPISSHATVGLYYFDKGSDFVKYAIEMIEANDRTNNEFYLAPTYNYLIKDHKKIITYDIEKFYSLGTIEDLEEYLKLI